ncbi:MAG TPA: ABC transporter permease [Candidatus Binatia bacterium]|nr:ABC transporter permease [Candidatus Binatia bacterium]
MSARPAPALRAVAALTSQELRLAARRGENLLVTLVIPVAVLLFFGGTSLLAVAEPVPFLVPGTIALGIVAAGLVNLGIATAYERHYGVLKRLGGAPIPRWAFVAAKVAAVLVIELVQVVVLAAAANLAFGWTPGPSGQPLLVFVAVALGTVAFVGLGLLLAGALRAEAVLAIANGLFLALLMLGGVVLPVDHLPELLRPIAAVLPSSALADLLRHGLDAGTTAAAATDPTTALAILTAWAVGATVLAARTFRWD